MTPSRRPREGRRTARWSVVVLLGVLASRDASADDASEAKGLFNQGVKLTESGDLPGALAAFRAAHEKLPNYRVLYNIGKLCKKTEDYACAVRSFEQYLGEGGGEIAAKRKAEVESELASAKAASGTIAITVSAAGADVTVDETAVGRSPLATPVVVNPGSHKIVVRHEGKSTDRAVSVAAGEAATVDLQLPKEPPAAADGPKEEPAAPRRARRSRASPRPRRGSPRS